MVRAHRPNEFIQRFNVSLQVLDILQVDELESTSQVPLSYYGPSVGPIEPAL